MERYVNNVTIWLLGQDHKIGRGLTDWPKDSSAIVVKPPTNTSFWDDAGQKDHLSALLLLTCRDCHHLVLVQSVRDRPIWVHG